MSKQGGVPFLSYESLRQTATRFLGEHHPSGTIPVPIECIIEFDFRLDIVPIPGLRSEFSTDAFISSDFKTISVDDALARVFENRYRFSLAHELAHLILHKTSYGSYQFSTIAEWKAVSTTFPDDDSSRLEYQAHALAGLMLVPSDSLLDRVQHYIRRLRKASLSTATGEAIRRVTLAVAGDFAVSSGVIDRRIRFDKLEGKFQG